MMMRINHEQGTIRPYTARGRKSAAEKKLNWFNEMLPKEVHSTLCLEIRKPASLVAEFCNLDQFYLLNVKIFKKELEPGIFQKQSWNQFNALSIDISEDAASLELTIRIFKRPIQKVKAERVQYKPIRFKELKITDLKGTSILSLRRNGPKNKKLPEKPQRVIRL